MNRQRYTITLTPLAPFHVGAHQVTLNHFDTLDFVPAPVLQAAFARRILESHGAYDLSGRERHYYVEDISEEGCEPQWIPWLKSFSNLSFTAATPFGAECFSPTELGCKYDSSHPIVNSLVYQYRSRSDFRQMREVSCAECGERLERKNGWNLTSGKAVQRRTVSRTSIDAKRHSSADRQLFTMQLAEPFVNSQREPVKLIGDLLVQGDEEMSLELTDEVIRVGKHITVGLGKMRVEVKKAPPKPFPQEQIAKWRAAVGDRSVPVKLNSQLLFAFPGDGGEAHAELSYYHEMYENWLRCTAGFPDGARVVFVSAQHELKRIFQSGTFAKQEQLSRFLQAGSLIVVEPGDACSEEQFFNWLHGLHIGGIRTESYGSTVTIAPHF